MKAPIVYFVIPCYNESDCLQETKHRLEQKLSELVRKKEISEKSKVVFIDDGSKDDTWEQIEQSDKRVVGIKLSRNCGHQNALMAGLLYAKDYCDAAISMDADLQDSIEAIDAFIAKFKAGAEVIYGVRSSRKTDSFFKRNTALAFYRLMNFLGTNTVYNHADYRLLSQRALEELANYREINLFLRGIIPTLGFNTATVEYERAERFAGESKYPLRKMLNFAVDGITSFSIKPIRLVFLCGVSTVFVALALLCGLIIAMTIFKYVVFGWLFVLDAVLGLGGVQLIALGIIGEYVGKTYIEVKARPRFIIEKIK